MNRCVCVRIISIFKTLETVINCFRLLLYAHSQFQRMEQHSLVNARMTVTIYRVLNMDIFLTQTHRFSSEGLYEPLEPCGVLFMMGGYTFLASKYQPPFTIRLREESHIDLGWLGGE